MSVSDPGLPDNLLLKVTAPRLPGHLISRRALDPARQAIQTPSLLVQAPAGYGKTCLLSSWRKHFLSQGVGVGWLTCQSDDSALRLIQALILSIRMAAARPSFGRTLMFNAEASALEWATAWLSEVAHAAVELALVIDDVDKLKPDALAVVDYVLQNAPSNLRLIMGARPDCSLNVSDLLAYGRCTHIGKSALRFTLEDTVELLNQRFSDAVQPDLAARVHEMSEGWPLGIQLLMSAAVQAGGEPVVQLAQLTQTVNRYQTDWMDMLLDNLDEGDRHFLVLASCLDHMNAALCEHVTGDGLAKARLDRLSAQTPLVSTSERGEWMRLHALARKRLKALWATLPTSVQTGCHIKAAQWHADKGMLDNACFHALEAGEHDLAMHYAERGLYDSLMERGEQSRVFEWLERMPPEVWKDRQHISLACAWSLATSDRHTEARRWVHDFLEGSDASPALQCEAAMILAGAAVFADDPDDFARLHDPWASNPPISNPTLLHVHANRTAYRTLLSGNPALARMKQQMAPALGSDDSYIAQWSDLIIGLTYLWEGQVLLVDPLLRPTLARSEAERGRRNPFACMIAALLSTAVWERGGDLEALTMLAHRLDVLEKRGLPETILLSYRTLARAAVLQQQEHRAIELLEGLHAIGQSRALPRLSVASLTEQIRLHARSYRAHTCEQLFEQQKLCIAQHGPTRGPLWNALVQSHHDLAQGHVHMARKSWRAAAQAFERVGAHAASVKMGRLRIEAMGLQAFCLDQCGEQTRTVMKEAMALAQAFDLKRVFYDAHPDLALWMTRIDRDEAPPVLVKPPSSEPRQNAVAGQRLFGNQALTPKEREVVSLLARNLSNKEIGLALQVGEETVKWHMKNLFAKLDAGNRKQVLARARLFGLVDE